MTKKPNPHIAQVPSGLGSGSVVGRELEHFAIYPGAWEIPEALCRGQQLAGVRGDWPINAEATGVNPHRICRKCVRVAIERGFKVEIVPEIEEGS